MLIGVPKEIKSNEHRIGCTPAGVRELVHHGHQVMVQRGGALTIGFEDAHYEQAGAEIVESPEEIFRRAEMIIKVKEPQPGECAMLRPGQVLFTYLHLAPDPEQARRLIDSGATCIAYETVTSEGHGLPLLAPMSEVAGRMAIQAGAYNLEITQGGDGILLGGVPGVEPARVLVIGGGVVGINAARMAAGLGADVTILDRSITRLQELEMIFGGRIRTVFSTRDAIERYALESDLVIGAVLIPGAAAPKLVSAEMVTRMKKGAVMVDVAIDQEPTYIVDGVVHYCVANMPGGVARTSTIALTNATLPYALHLAGRGAMAALREDAHLRNGLNVHAGMVTHRAVAEALGYEYVDALAALEETGAWQST
jgi:alanine dehydrogenase